MILTMQLEPPKITIALVLSLVPQSYAAGPVQNRRIYIADAPPPTAPCTRHTIDVVGPKGCCGLRRCPSWVTTLAQSKLYGLYTAAKIAAYEGHGTACIGVGIDTARYQALRQRATTQCPVQNRLLRRLFWLCLCGAASRWFFSACTQPKTRHTRYLSSFPSMATAIKEADTRQFSSSSCAQPYAISAGLVTAFLTPPLNLTTSKERRKPVRQAWWYRVEFLMGLRQLFRAIIVYCGSHIIKGVQGFAK